MVVRDEEWLVTATEPTTGGALLHVQGLSELVREVEASFYTSLDRIEVLDPAAATVVADGSPGYRSSRLWLEATLRKTAVAMTEEALTASTQGLARPLAYQQSAVRKALDPANLRVRILLADAVGLGKTLEIGMILSELVRRGRGDRILVVTPRHVLEQMQHELWSRFALPFVRLDSAGIQRVRQKLPATRNPFAYFKRAIISIDTLKSDKYVAFLAKHRWDAVVIDESHNLTNTATLNNRLARLLARTSDALILASATPHNGRAESFAELIRLLDPSAVHPDGSLIEDEVKRLVIRRHRSSPEVAQVVGADWAERRDPLLLPVKPSPAEDAVADELERVWLHPGKGRSPYSGQTASLFPWTLAKAFLSSPAALAETIQERMKRVSATDAPGSEAELEALDRLLGLTTTALASPSGKYKALLRHLSDTGVGPGSSMRVVVFAERVKTLGWLRKQIQKDLRLGEGAVAVLHGGLPDHKQLDLVKSFKKESSPIRVLVTGDVASEGVNLHLQCHELVHFDIPWSLIRIEQRNGRIDRYGQKIPPRITTLVLDPSGEQFAGDVRILAKLIEREHEAHRALGDAASLIGAHNVEAEEEMIRRVLAGEKKLEDVVRTPDEVLAGDDFDAFFWRVAEENDETKATREPAVGALAPEWQGTGLYADTLTFLDEALHEAYTNPGSPADNSGVAWRRHDNHGVAELVPPHDLLQRLEVLPQDYLSERHVARLLKLATTRERGEQQLAAALDDQSDCIWPESHYLAPLHPVLEWARSRSRHILPCTTCTAST
nr:helicase-related protein [Kineosporia sp. NBRC 101677]